MALLWPILKTALANRHKVAVIDDRRRMTYAELLGGAMFLAERIDAATSNPHVGLLLPTSGAGPVAILAAWLARRVAVPFNYLLTKDELAYVIADSGVDTIVTVGPMIEFLGGAANLPPNIKLLYLEDIDFTGLPPLRWPPCPADDDLAVILYTSGTSAKPKGVMLTHGNLHSNVDAALVHAGIRESHIFFGVLPQFHSFGLTALTLLPLRAGCTTIYTARFIPKRVVELIRKHKPQIMMAVPSMYAALLTVKDACAEDFASVEIAISGGEALSNAVFEAVRQRLNVQLLEGYGLTETAPILNWCTQTRFRRHSVGQSLPEVHIAIVDEAGRVLPPDREGEIFAAGPNIMKGYYKLPRQTAEVFVELDRDSLGDRQRRPYFRTGDIGKVDADGYLYITGRKKEMLKVAGEIVFPREVEEVLNRHPSVRDAAVIGRQDDLRGEVPMAFVEMQEGAAFDENALRTWCRDNLAGFKVPREIQQIDALPRNPTGKILRRKLTELVTDSSRG
ncbi:MAG: AMP-binding protein [Phycisphaeraceae bacterium]